MEELAEVVKKYPCAFPIWLGPFQAFFFICDPDYARTFLNRTGKTRNESQEPHPPKSDMHKPQGGLQRNSAAMISIGPSRDTGVSVERFPTNPEGDSHVPLGLSSSDPHGPFRSLYPKAKLAPPDYQGLSFLVWFCDFSVSHSPTSPFLEWESSEGFRGSSACAGPGCKTEGQVMTLLSLSSSTWSKFCV